MSAKLIEKFPMKKTILSLIFSSISVTAGATEISFDGNFIYAVNADGIANKILLNDTVGGSFNFALSSPDDLNPPNKQYLSLSLPGVRPEVMSLQYTAPGTSSAVQTTSQATAFKQGVATDNVVFSFLNNFHVDESVLKEHGLWNYINPADAAYGDWDIVSLTSLFTIPQANGQPNVVGHYTLFAAYDKTTFDISNFNLSDYAKIFSVDPSQGPKAVFLEAQTDNTNDFHGTAVVNAYLGSRTDNLGISAVPVPAVSWLFAAACMGLFVNKRKAI